MCGGSAARSIPTLKQRESSKPKKNRPLQFPNQKRTLSICFLYLHSPCTPPTHSSPPRRAAPPPRNWRACVRSPAAYTTPHTHSERERERACHTTTVAACRRENPQKKTTTTNKKQKQWTGAPRLCCRRHCGVFRRRRRTCPWTCARSRRTSSTRYAPLHKLANPVALKGAWLHSTLEP